MLAAVSQPAARCEYEPPFQWLTGMNLINHHTLSDFRVEHRQALDELFTQVLAVLSSEGLVTLERVTHYGTKVYANASKKSFRVKNRIEEHLRILLRGLSSLSIRCRQLQITNICCQQCSRS